MENRVRTFVVRKVNHDHQREVWLALVLSGNEARIQILGTDDVPDLAGDSLCETCKGRGRVSERRVRKVVNVEIFVSSPFRTLPT